jgi:hypothetical protein
MRTSRPFTGSVLVFPSPMIPGRARAEAATATRVLRSGTVDGAPASSRPVRSSTMCLLQSRLLAGLLSGALAAAMLSAPQAQAATFCVTSSAQLQSALDSADSNGEDDIIRIAQGTYPAPAGGPFRFRGGAAFNGDDNDLTLVGGFVSANGAPCGLLPPGAGALDTLLDGELRQQVLEIVAGEGSDVSILGIGFLSGRPSQAGTTRGGGLRLETVGDTAGTFLVQRSLFIGNQADCSAAADISGSRVTRFINNLVAGNNTIACGAAVGLVQNDGTGIYVINNTIVNNTTSASTSPGRTTGLDLFVGGSSRALVTNNILYNNEFNDVSFAGTGFTTSRNNSIGRPVGSATVSQNNLSIAPEFVGGLLDYNLAPDSALVDAGVMPSPIIPFPPPFESNWSLPGDDLDGGPRVIDGAVDIGAYETRSLNLFANGFE